MEPPFGHQVYSASRIRLDSLVSCCAVVRISGYEMLLVLIFLDCPRNSLFSCYFVHPSFFFILFAFHFCLLFCFGPSDSNETDFREWAALEALAAGSGLAERWEWGG